MNARWTICGHGHLLGDIIDAIHLNGDKVSRIIHNIDEPDDPKRLSFPERLKLVGYEIPIVSLDEFEPNRDRYILGFNGFKAKSLVDLFETKFGIQFNVLKHPAAFISPTAKLGDGTFVNAMACVAPYVEIGHHTTLNRCSSIGHNTTVEPYCVVQPNAALAGYIRLCYGAYVGMGSNVIECLSIGDKSVIAAGSTVITDVPPMQMWAGTPAKFKKDVNNA